MCLSIDHINSYVSNVDNADKLLKKLKLKGYAAAEQHVIVKQYSRQIYIKDPDGMEIDLIEWTDKQGFYNNLKIDKEEQK